MLCGTKATSRNVVAKYNFQPSSQLFLISCLSCVTAADGNWPAQPALETHSQRLAWPVVVALLLEVLGLDLGLSLGKDYKTEGSYQHCLFTRVLGNGSSVTARIFPLKLADSL